MDFLQLLLLPATLIFIAVIMALRNLLGYPLEIASLRRASRSVDVPDSLADLLPDLHARATALGFEGPTWLEVNDPDSPLSGLPFALYFDASRDTELLVAPPINPARPHQLLVQFSSMSAAGVALCTLWNGPVQLPDCTTMRSRVGNEPVLDAALAAHRAWAAAQGPLIPAPEDPDAWISRAGQVNASVHAEMLERGDTVRSRHGRSVPSWRMALRMFGSAFTGPRAAAPAGPSPIPIPRLLHLAGVSRRMQLLSPDPGRQWTLFLASVALFVLLGAALWGTKLALLLLLVVAIHELGHFLAMRAFGYRNTQMLALPLVGGVAIGHEERPRAASRAWMSLAGPVPGILIGWGIVAWLVLLPAGSMPFYWAALLGMAAGMFLFVNYLNLLPIPPLDGGHVVQVLLPRQAPQAQAWFVIVGAAAGLFLAIQMGWLLLGMIFALQLLTVPALFAQARLLRHCRAAGVVDFSAAPVERLRQVLQACETVQGPALFATTRIRTAENVLRALELEPMPRRHFVAITVLLAACVVVPVLMLKPYWGQPPYKLLSQLWRAGSPTAPDEATRQLIRQSEQLDLGTLVAMEPGRTRRGTGASEDVMEQVEGRLGFALPDDLRDLYRIDAEGARGYGLRALAALGALDQSAVPFDWRRWFDDPAEAPQLQGRPAAGQRLRLETVSAATLVAVLPRGRSVLLYLPDRQRPYVEVNMEVARDYDNLTAWLQLQWYLGRKRQLDGMDP